MGEKKSSSKQFLFNFRNRNKVFLLFCALQVLCEAHVLVVLINVIIGATAGCLVAFKLIGTNMRIMLG